jgi:hypothetical protein
MMRKAKCCVTCGELEIVPGAQLEVVRASPEEGVLHLRVGKRNRVLGMLPRSRCSWKVKLKMKTTDWKVSDEGLGCRCAFADGRLCGRLQLVAKRARRVAQENSGAHTARGALDWEWKYARQEPMRVLATTGMIGDIARNIGGKRVQVTTLMGPGVDPHLYKASPGDVGKLSNADIVFYNGLHLEGKMIEFWSD